MRTLAVCLLWFLLAVVFFLIGVSLHGGEPKLVQAADFNGRWAMQWGESSHFEQIFRPDGTSDCLGMFSGYYGTWTSARANEITVAETCYSLPAYEKSGPEIEFTLAVKSAKWCGGKLERVELEGDYLGGTVKVVLVREQEKP